MGPVPEMGSLVETDQVALPDIVDEGRMILDAPVELGGGVTSVRDAPGVLPPGLVDEPGAGVVGLPGHADE